MGDPLPVISYRVVCLTCDEGQLPLYEANNEVAARRFFASGLRRQGHDVRLQRAEYVWADVSDNGEMKAEGGSLSLGGSE